MIGKTTLALAAAAAIAALSVLLVWSSGYALYSWLLPLWGAAGASAAVAVAGAFVLSALILGASMIHARQEEERTVQQQEALSATPEFVGSLFPEIVRDRPLVTLGVSVLTGLVAVRYPGLFKDFLAAALTMRKKQSD